MRDWIERLVNVTTQLTQKASSADPPQQIEATPTDKKELQNNINGSPDTRITNGAHGAA